MHISIDIEAFGKAPKGAISSIGCCQFSDKIGKTFYVNVLAEDRVIDEDTIRWWLQQDKEAQNALFTPKPIGLDEALFKLSEFVADAETIWANGITYDMDILRNAFAQRNRKVPWKYNQEMCLRPIRFLGKKLNIEYGENRTTGTKHNSLDDAVYQAEYLIKVLKEIEKK